MMKNSLFLLLYALIFVMSFTLLSCRSKTDLPQLAWGKYYLWNAPDSALRVLSSIVSPEQLSEEDRALYALLMTQAMHRSGQPISSDSLINVAIGYYALHGNNDEKATAYLHKGYILENLNRDKEAMVLFKQAEEEVKTAKDIRLHFLVYSALGMINSRYAHYEQAVPYYKKALDLNLSVPCWEAMGGWAFAPFYLAAGTPRYNEEVKLMHEKLFGLINRMDFASQEKIYYQLALKEIDEREWESAASFLLKTLQCAATAESRYRYDVVLANVYRSIGKTEQADSLRKEALKSSRPLIRASVYKDVYKEMLERGDREAENYMQHYIDELELLYTMGSRVELLEIEKKYDKSALLRQNNDFSSRWAITILITVTIVCSLALLLWVSWKFFRGQKREILRNYKKEASALQQRIDTLQEQIGENQDEAKSLLEQLDELETEKRNKEVRIRQLEVTFRSKHISLPVETVEATQVYLQIVAKGNASYHPASDRTKLEHWLNVSHEDWANRLAVLYPTLTNGEKDICYLFALGLTLEPIAALLEVQSRSVERSIYRICRKMGLEQGSKEEFVAQISRMNDRAINK